MNTTNKTVLVTGGGSGIGFEIAKLLSQKGNKVIITGRTEAKLQKAASQLENVSVIVANVNSEADVDKLVSRITTEFGGLDILVNNAGHANYYKIGEGVNAHDKAAGEMQTNFLSIIRLTEKFLPALKASAEAAIVNVTSIVAFVPGVNLPTYSASKAALHSYSQGLRFILALKTGIKVFELMPPLVNTEFSTLIGGENGMPPEEVAQALVTAFENDEYEIHVGNTANIYKLFLSSPQAALNTLNKGR